MAGFMEREGADIKNRWARAMVLLTCLVMVLVVADQGGTIDKQRNLIQLLWSDSKQMTHLQLKELARQHRDKADVADPQLGPDSNASPKVPDSNAAPAPKAEPVQPPKPARVLWRT